MPLTAKRYTANAAAIVSDPDAFDSIYQLRVSLEVNDFVFPPALCAKLTAAFHAAVLEHAVSLTDISSNVNEIEIPTKDETEAKIRKQAETYYEEMKKKGAESGEGTAFEIIEDQKPKATWYRLQSRKLEIVNDLLDADSYSPVSKDDWSD